MRGWTDDKIEKEWAYLDATTAVASKKWGGPLEDPLQLPIPPWMIGEEAGVLELDHFEMKSSVSESRPLKLSVEDFITPKP